MWQIGDAAGRPDWRVLDTRLDCNLYAVVQTVEGPYAVGGHGTVAARRDAGWTVVFDDGPATRQNQLRAVDVTDDGERIWLVGSSGTIACYDVQQRRKFDYGYPEELTATFEGITVAGPRGAEKVLAADGDGSVFPFAVDGKSPEWGRLERVAADGATVAALASTPGGVGFVVDTAGRAYKTTPGEGWTDIGVVATDVAFADIAAGPDQQVYVAAGDGHLYRYGDTYHSWTPIEVGDGGVRALDVYDAGDGRKQMTVLGTDGTVYERTAADRWEALPVPADTSLYGLSLGCPDVIVGKDGILLERRRGRTRHHDGLAETSDGGVAAPDGRIGTE